MFADPSGQLGIEQVAAQAFAPIPVMVARGYFEGAHWLRLKVRPAYPGERIVLRVRPSYLDALTLYSPHPHQSGAWLAQHSGDTVSFMQRPFAALTLGFEIAPRTPSVYYLRLQSTSTHVLRVEALAWQAARLADIQLGMGKWIYLMLMLWICLSAAFVGIVQRDALLAWFVLAHTLFVAYAFATMGFLAPLLPYWPADVLTSVLVLLIGPSAYWFHYQLVAPFKPPPLALRCLKLLVCVSTLCLPLYLMGHQSLALHINTVLGLLLALLLPLLAALARHQAPPGLGALRFAYGLSALALLLSISTILGWLPQMQSLAFYGIYVPGFISAVLVAGLLYLRSRALAHTSEQAQLQAALALQQQSTDRSRLQEQQRFMDMLTHELKTPLATAHLSLDTLHAQGLPASAAFQRIERALSDIGSVIERCRQSNQFEHGTFGGQLQDCDLADLLHQALDNARNHSSAQPLQLAQPLPVARLRSDPILIGVVVGNLIDNALKYGAPNSAIDISLCPAHRPASHPVAAAVQGQSNQGPGWCLSVRNRIGPAGAPDPARVFQKYYRASAAHSKIGSGLGLYLAHGVAAQLGGHLACQSDADTVVFQFWLPA
ncbi:MAG: hypothetical protein KGZ61_12120 [Sandarakinorhabdus sp.]|nr:hypothetical protein [Sandarakinorhabdus sp.]